MSKRTAVSELNDRNWDAEEEEEEAGTFIQASKNVLEQRTIKKAKRRVIGEETTARPSAFSGFSGFSDKKTVSNMDAFSGFKKSVGDTNSSSKTSNYGGTSSVNGNEDVKMKGQDKSTSDHCSYLSCLKSLNEGVLSWIKQHVESNPYIILTPVFKDYEKFLEGIKADKSVATDDVNQSESRSSPNKAVTRSVVAALTSKSEEDMGKPLESVKTKAFTFGQATESSNSKPITFGQTSGAPASGGFNFAVTTSSNTASTTKASSTNATPGAGFFFNSSSSGSSSLFGKTAFTSSGSTNPPHGGFFSFGKTNTTQESTAADSKESGEQDEEYEPPKPEVKEIVETDALHSIRCKLYYQKDGQWIDKGVGNLHLKPVAENKTQLLIRADTNLGNVLLNVMLSASLPASRQGKNNVLIVCVPNPPLTATAGDDSTPIPMLMRVKTEQDADELLAKIDERKKLLS